MANTVVQQPKQAPAPASANAAAHPAPASNSQAAATAQVDRRRKSAAAVSKDWQTALGGLLPPEATTAAPKLVLHPPALDLFRHDTYKLAVRAVSGFEAAVQYLTDAEVDKKYQDALRSVGQNATPDRAALTEIRTAVVMVCTGTGGDLGQASIHVLAALARTTEDGKQYLRANENDILTPLQKFIGNASNFPDPQSPATKTKRAQFEALWTTLHTATPAPGMATATPPTAAPGAATLTAAQATARTKITAEITTEFPYVAGGKVVPATPAQITKLRHDIDSADPAVRDAVYAWRDDHGRSALQLLGMHASPDQVHAVNLSLDGVERLVASLDDMTTRGGGDNAGDRATAAKLVHDFLAAHLNDQTTRDRVRDNAPLMQRYVRNFPDAQRKVIMRMIASGHEQPDAVDKVHDACDAGDSGAAVSAIYELGQTPAKLQTLRADLVFVHRLQDRCGKAVAWHGVSVKPYELFLQMCGVDPHQTQEAGAAPKQIETDPLSQNKPLSQQEQQQLEAEVYNPFSKPLADELNAWVWVNDSTVMGLLHKFAAAAATHADLLRRGHQAPGPELARRIQGYHCDVRLKLQRGLDKENLVQAERILGFATDQATVGVIGGAGTLAADTRPADKAKVPLEQALRETMIGGAVLTEVIHGKAAELAAELDRWFGARADHVRGIWQSYSGQVNAKVCAQLRDQTGLPRVWAIELLANAFVQVGNGTLQSRIQQALGRDHNDVITQMGLQPTDIASRKTLAETKTVQDNKNEAVNTQQLVAAHDHVEQAAKVDSFRVPAKALFEAFANLRQDAPDSDLKHLGTVLAADLKLDPIAVGAPIKSATEQPGGAAPVPGTTASAQPASTDFASFYHHEYGVDPRRHAVEVAKSLGQSRSRDAKAIGALLGVSDPSLYAPPTAVAGELAITAANLTLVAPGFTVDEAQRRAQKMWDLLRSDGAIQLIRAQFDGRTPEEQRLIKVAFARLSGGMDLAFYIQQQAVTANRHADGDDGVVVAGGNVHMSGSKAETDMLLKVAQNGRLTLEDRLTGSISANQMDDVYAAIEGATPDERRAILANDALMNKLRKFGNDSYEWNRIYKGLAGDSDLFDRLESHAHGKHGFIGAFEGTDKEGMTRDIAGYAKQRKIAIRVQVLTELAGGVEPTDKPTKDKIDAEVTKRLTAEFQSVAENPSVRAILHDELSGAALSAREGMLLNGGDENKAASALTEGDWTDDKAKIIADIKAMSPAQRKALRENPEYLDQLRRDIGGQGKWRDAMIALGSDVDGSVTSPPDDNYGALEHAARTGSEDTNELFIEHNDLIQSLSKLSPEEYARLQGDPRMQQQVLYALRNYPEQLALARQMMAFNASDAAAMTGLKTGDKPDPTHGVYTPDQVARIAFLKFGAINRLKAGASRTWAMLLEASVAVYGLKLKPSDNPPAPPATDPAAGAAPEIATPTPSAGSQQATGTPAHGTPAVAGASATANAQPLDPNAGESAIEARLRHEILAAVQDDIATSTAGWGEQQGDDGKTHAHRMLSTSEQQTIIAAAVLHNADPSDALLARSTGEWFGTVGNDKDRVKDTIRKASDDRLIHEWTTVVHHAPNGTPSLVDRYTAWKATRPADAQPAEKRAPKVGSPEWNARTAFKAYVIDTSDTFEDLLIRFTGGIGADNDKTAPGADRVRGNNEWLEWRSLVRDRIPQLDRKKIGETIGASGDPEAIAILTDPTLSNTLGALAYDEERYQVDRGEHSNYNMDRVTAGGAGLTVDNAMGDYRRAVLTSVTSDGANAGEDYGKITADESARIATAKERFSKSTTDFRAAKAAVANVATTIAMLVVTTVVTVLTAGLATGPLAAIMLATLTAASASAGSQLTRKAIQGTDFEIGNEGLKNLARDTVLGAVTMGSTMYASKIAAEIIDVSSATEQAAIISGIAKDRSFFAELGKSAIEQGAQVSLQGVFETGQAAFDPAMWMDGWKEGWIRGGSAARDRASQIPEESIKAALLIAFAKLGKQGSRAALGGVKSKLGGAAVTETETEEQVANDETAEVRQEREAQEQAERDAAAAGQHDGARHAAFGNRETIGQRTATVGKAMVGSIEDGFWMGVGQGLASEKTWDGQAKMTDFLGGVGSNVISMMMLASNSVYTSDAVAAHRYRTGAQELTKNGGGLSENEKRVYAELVIHGTDETAITVKKYVALRQARMDRAVAEYNSKASEDPAGAAKSLTSEQKQHFEHWIKDATSLAELESRLLQGPDVVVANGPMGESVVGDRSDSAILREHTLHEATEAAKHLDASQDKFKPTIDVAPPALRLKSLCEVHAKELPADSVQNKEAAALLAKVEEVNTALEADLKYCSTLSSMAKDTQLLLHRRIAEARANRGNPAKAAEAFKELRTMLAFGDFQEEGASFRAADQSAQRHLAELQGLSRQIEALTKQRAVPVTTPTPVNAVVPVAVNSNAPSRSTETSSADRVQLKRMLGTVGTPEAAAKLDETTTAPEQTKPIETTETTEVKDHNPLNAPSSNGMVARLKAGEAVPVPKHGTAYESMKEIARATGQDVMLVRLADGGGVRMMMGIDHEADLPEGTTLIATVAKNGQAMTYDAGPRETTGVPATPARMAELLRKQSAEEKRDKALKPDITGPLATPEGKALGESLPPPPPGMIRLVDGTLAKGNGTPIDAATRAWLEARKAERAEFSGAPRNIVIDGGGPTGALTALQAFMLGSTVTLVESREEATLPILWTNRPGVMEVLMLIDPVLAKRMQAQSGEVKFYDHVSPDGHNDHHAIDAQSRQLDPARATGDPRKIAGESSTWTSQNKTEVELIWTRLGELADKEAASAKRAGRPPRLVLKRGYDVVELPVDGNKRGVVIQQSENRLFKVDANKQNVLGDDGQPITMDYKTGDKIPPGWEKKKVQHEREDLGTPDDVFTADGAGSKGRGMAGGKSVDVGPSARFIAGYFHGVGLEGTDKDGNTVQGGAKTNSEIGTDGRELHAVASSGSHLDAATWGLPEVDPNLDFKNPESIEKYFGKPMTEQDAVLLYYKTQMAKMNNRPLADFDNITFDQLPNGMGPGGRGPSPFTLQSHVTGDMADDATNVHALGDSGGNSHFFASLGKGTGTGTHQMAFRQYEQALEWGMDPEIAAAILQRRLDAGTRVWLKSGLPGFTDRSTPVAEPVPAQTLAKPETPEIIAQDLAVAQTEQLDRESKPVDPAAPEAHTAAEDPATRAKIIPLVAPGTQGQALADITPERRAAAREKYSSVIALLEAGEHVPMPTGSASVEMMAGITIATGKEVALLRAPHEVRYLMLGDAPVGLPADVKVIAHTHPSGTLLLSPDDQAAISATEQLSTVVISPDGLAGRLRIDPQAAQLDQSGSRQINDVKEAVGDGPTPDRKKQLGLSDKTVELGGQQRPASRIMEILGSRMAPLKLVNTPGKVMWVDMDLARELGFKVPAGNVMTQALHDEIIATLSYRVLPAGEDPNGAAVVTGGADRYQSLGLGGSQGAGRAAFLPGLNANIKGSGRTPLAAPLTGNSDFTHSHGGAPAREGLLEASWGLVSDNLFANKGTRILAVIDTGDNTGWADGSSEPRALIIRAGNQIRPAHVNVTEGDTSSANLFAAMAREGGFLVEKGGKPDLHATMLNEIDRQAETAAEQFRFRILHGAVNASNMEVDGGMLDHGTTTSVSRTEPAKILDHKKTHFGTEQLDRAYALETVYDSVRDSVRDKPAPIDFGSEMEKRFNAHMSVQMLDATGLKTDLAEHVADKQPKLVAELRDVLVKLAGLSEHTGTVNVDKQAAPQWSTVDIFNMLGELPGRYFANPTGDHRAEILQLLKVQGTMPAETSRLIDVFADRYGKVMKAAQGMSAGYYDSPADMERSVTNRAKFENQPLDLLSRGDLGQKLNDAITEFRSRSQTMAVDDPELRRPIKEAVDKQVASSIRSVEGLLKQGSPKKLADGGIESEQRTIDGINYSVRAWPNGTRRLHISIPVDGNDGTGYTFPTLRVNAVAGAPHLFRDQIDAMTFRFTVDGWTTPGDVNAKLDSGEVTFDIPALASDVGRLEGVFRSQSRGDFWWRDGQSNFRGYNFAVPDNQEFGQMEQAAGTSEQPAMATGAGSTPTAPVPGGQPTETNNPTAPRKI